MSGEIKKPPANGIRHFKPYSAYKDAGIEWLGRIPMHWDVARADAFLRYDKHHVEPLNIRSELVFHYSIPSVQETGDGTFEPPSDIDSAKLQILGDRLLVSKLNPRKGVVLIASAKGVPTICSTEFVPFEVRGCELRWAMYMFLAEPTRQRLSAAVRSATRSHQRAKIADIVKMWHAVPTTSEQCSIAKFLDRETAKIDELIARKRRVIELLEEKRAVLVTDAVTKGIDSNVRTKDSGLGWLGKIPAHWDVKKLKHMCNRVFVGIAEAATFAYVDDGVPILRSTDVRANRIRTDEVRRIDRDFANRLSSKRLEVGDIVTVRTGNAGVSAIVPAEYDGGQCFTLVVSRPAAECDARYLCYWLNAATGQHQFAIEGMGTAQVNISVPIVQNTIVCVPPEKEQKIIADWIEKELAYWDALIKKIGDAIECLGELRTALVSAAVTGKIDVREEVA